MLKKINITLAVLCLLGALFIAGVVVYSNIDDVSQGKVAQQVGGSW